MKRPKIRVVVSTPDGKALCDMNRFAINSAFQAGRGVIRVQREYDDREWTPGEPAVYRQGGQYTLAVGDYRRWEFTGNKGNKLILHVEVIDV